MEPKYIAALEIGSSRIKGTVAAVDATAGINVLAVEETPSADSVRYGRVQNAREASARVEEIIRRLENNPAVAPARISAVFVANGGRSLASASSEATVNLSADSEVSALTLERLHKEARYNLGTDRDVLAVIPKRYFADNVEMKTIVGSFGKAIRGEFTFLTCSPENLRNLQRVKMTSGERELHCEYVTRLIAQTEMALTDSDRQLGCLYLDFGAQTTTMAVFRDGALQMACVLPMGSQNITRDLSVGLSMTEDSAENLKITKGEAVNERANISAPDAETREVINFVSARVGEIVANVIHRLTQAGFKPAELTAGIVVSGGGARLKGFAETLEAQTKMKVRPAAVDRSISARSASIDLAGAFDLLALVKYAASHYDIGCLEFPERTAPAAQTDVARPGAQRVAAAAAARKAPMDENDPRLLEDDLDEPLDQPDNVIDDPDELPEPGPDPDTTRRSLIERLKNWIAPKVDDNLDDEND